MRPLVSPLLLLLIAFVLVACGGDEDDNSSDQTGAEDTAQIDHEEDADEQSDQVEDGEAAEDTSNLPSLTEDQVFGPDEHGETWVAVWVDDIDHDEWLAPSDQTSIVTTATCVWAWTHFGVDSRGQFGFIIEGSGAEPPEYVYSQSMRTYAHPDEYPYDDGPPRPMCPELNGQPTTFEVYAGHIRITGPDGEPLTVTLGAEP